MEIKLSEESKKAVIEISNKVVQREYQIFVDHYKKLQEALTQNGNDAQNERVLVLKSEMMDNGVKPVMEELNKWDFNEKTFTLIRKDDPVVEPEKKEKKENK
jgi:hypothetical protein